MHKNPLQNTGKGIKGTLVLGTFRGSMPLEPSRGFCAFSASRADSCVPPPKKFLGPYAYAWNLSKFVVLKHFGWEFLPEEPCCCLDVSICMIKCVFC